MITFERNEILQLIMKQEATDFRLSGKENDKTIVQVSSGEKIYTIDTEKDEHDASYLNELNALNPKNFILLNHASVILKWEDDLQILIDKLKDILGRTDKYFIIPVTTIAASNMINPNSINNIFSK